MRRHEAHERSDSNRDDGGDHDRGLLFDPSTLLGDPGRDSGAVPR